MNNKWQDKLQRLIEQRKELDISVENVNLPQNFCDDFSAEEAIEDLSLFHSLNENSPVQIRLLEHTDNEHQFAIKLYVLNDAMALSYSMPILESMGLMVFMQQPYQIKVDGQQYWLHYFTLHGSQHICDIDRVKIPQFFNDLFIDIYNKQAEKDAFNQLLFNACLKGKNIQILRAYTAYLQQIRFQHSREYIIETLNQYPDISLILVKCFLGKFNPKKQKNGDYQRYCKDLDEKMVTIESLDHEIIIKRLFNLIEATVRTNFFQENKAGTFFLSFKLESEKIEKLPKPSPKFEIYVYSSRFEGIHLRGGKVARGGIRWSDRKEDYRTEVLGLMKAQMAKNAVIVPSGSKGGFITKQLDLLPVDKIFDEVKQCYSLYISALIELTDNLVEQKIQPPANTVRHDEDDPYLVVAADKGTATFSDTANAIAADHHFWLDDAFASGGSQGYDHKKMGITARGAWISVQRHFRNLGKDIQTEPFTVIGIGDMSGDVFGNGMLLSPCIQLVAAFNHMHIFIDPDPDIQQSTTERQRLFDLPRSSWSDYDQSIISAGGGVFSRKLKRITLSPEIKKLIDCNKSELTPDALISYLLKASVGLLWNGGIGTYIKASFETNIQVSDKANDAVRVNAKDLRVKVIGEGGNLGITQPARIEYAQKGGMIYADSIDNSAGVNCSDNEVNIKILLADLVREGKLNETSRNKLLVDMTDEIAQLCLLNNYRQTQILDIFELNAADNTHQHGRFMRHLERDKILSRKLEFLPDDEEIRNRITQHKGLTRPELSTLLSYSKLTYKNALLEASSLSEECYNPLLLDYFPRLMRQRYADEILQHPLRKEIIATLLSNKITNYIGIGFGSRIREETGASIEDIAKAYVVCVEVFDLTSTWRALESLDNKVPEHNRYECFQAVSGLLERSISWLLRNQSSNFDVNHMIERYKTDIKILHGAISSAIVGQSRRNYLATRKRFVKYKLPAALAQELTDKTTLASAFDIIEIKSKLYSSTENVAKLFYLLSERLQLHWIRDSISRTIVRTHWNHLAIVNLRNELHANQRNLTELVMQTVTNKRHTTKALLLWEKHNADALERYDHIISELSAIQLCDFPTITVAVAEIRRLVNLSRREHYDYENDK